MTFRKFVLVFSLFIFCLILLLSGSARSEWKGDVRVNVETAGKQASRGADCPWSISVDNNNRVHVVWEDRRHGYPLRIYYRGKDPDPTWMKWDNSDYELSTIDSVVMFGHPSIHPQSNGKLFSVYVEEKPFGAELYGSWIDDHPSKSIEADLVSSAGGNYLTFSSTGWQTTIAVSGDRTVTFWPYVNIEQSGSLPVYYRIYESGVPVIEETPVSLTGANLDYHGVHLSARAGSGNRVYLVCRLIDDDCPTGHIYMFTLDILTGNILEVRNLTPDESRICRFPYVAVSPRESGEDIIFVAFEIIDTQAKAVYITNINGDWSEPVVLSAGDNSSGHPCVTVNGEYAEFVFESPNSTSNTQLYHQRFDMNTKALSRAVQITDTYGYFNMRPVIASDSYGNLHLIYITNRENPHIFGNEEVYYSIYDSPPLQPWGFEYDDFENVISWRNNPEPDISHYEIEFNGRDTVLYDNYYDISRTSYDDFIVSVKAVDISGQKSRAAVYRSSLRGVREIYGTPRDLIVGENYPNPFNATTTIPVSATNMPYPLYLEVFDITGKIVKTFSINNSNRTEIIWNAKNDYAMPVSTGVYFYRLRSLHEFGKTKSMTLIK